MCKNAQIRKAHPSCILLDHKRCTSCKRFHQLLSLLSRNIASLHVLISEFFTRAAGLFEGNINELKRRTSLSPPSHSCRRRTSRISGSRPPGQQTTGRLGLRAEGNRGGRCTPWVCRGRHKSKLEDTGGGIKEKRIKRTKRTRKQEIPEN